jgi:RND family efflux transporter MFP subunit
VVREPQVALARAELQAAKAELAAAALALDRTTITLPFDGVVVSESVDPGQVVAPGRAVARVYGTATVEVRVPLDDRELQWFQLPSGPGTTGAVAEVTTRFAGHRHAWAGRVVRMEGQVDPTSRLVHVVVEVPRAFARTEGRPPLMPGTFVDVVIRGTVLNGVVPVPRHALHGGGDLWVVEDGLLRVRGVEVVRADRDTAYLSGGVSGGDLVVVSALDAVADGMAVRVPDQEPGTDPVVETST